MKFIFFLLISIFYLFSGCTPSENTDLPVISRDNTLTQTSPYNTMLDNVYDGDMTIGELRQYGDFALGTFNALDGELLGLDGVFYQIKSDGIAYPAADTLRTPFAEVTFFEPDTTVWIEHETDYEQLLDMLDSLRPSDNIFYAIKIEGSFDYVHAKSVPRQQKPYPPLSEVILTQPQFEHFDTGGAAAGVWCPQYIDGINVPGYHFHFITENRDAGGHVLECRIRNAKLEIAYLTQFSMILSETGEFFNADLSKNIKKELEKTGQYEYFNDDE